jgi:hypothetical protein
MLFNATFNNIVFIYRGDQLYWWSKQVLHEENHRPATNP